LRSHTGKSPLDAIATLAPDLVNLTRDLLLDDVWERPGLSKRDRSFITVAALVALNRPEQLRTHLQWAIKNGISREEIGESLLHLAFYCGWPAAISSALIARGEVGDSANQGSD
jgi:4-carboxymuconolactone decarboxylase